MFHVRNQNFLKITPFFISMATAAKFALPIQIFLTLPQLSWKQKRGDLNIFCIPFIKLHETL
jgi:hypothetical protein